MGLLEKTYSETINEHKIWLEHFSEQYLKRWGTLHKNNSEAAICEASVRKILSGYVDAVEPSEDLSSGGPDFLCTQKGKHFYVETKCITTRVATDKTGLEDKPQGKASGYYLLTDKILEIACKKTPQCSNLDSPCLLAIGTFHRQVGALCFNSHAAEQLLTGTPYITSIIDTQTGKMVKEPYQETNLQNSVPIRYDKDSPEKIEYARKTISAILLCSLGYDRSHVIGIMHPNPNHNFDRRLLPNIKFCRLSEGYESGPLIVEWI